MRLAALLLLAGHVVGGVTQVNLRGLSPEGAEQVKRFSSLTCDGGSRDVPVARFNDDYCDCADGADEPGALKRRRPAPPGSRSALILPLAGTSACANGRFHCENVGHSPQFLFSSRVNDGFCGAGAPVPLACCFVSGPALLSSPPPPRRCVSQTAVTAPTSGPAG